MRSRSERSRRGPRELSSRERVLLHVVGELGHRLDVLDPTDFDGINVRQLILHFEAASPSLSPAQVRGALHELYEARHVGTRGLDDSGRFMKAYSEVAPTCRGVDAARHVDPECGRPVQRVTFVSRKGMPMLNAAFDTGNEKRDEALNMSGTILAVALVVLVEQPTVAKPLLVEPCTQMVRRLMQNGVRQPSGPGLGALVSEATVIKSLDKVKSLLGLKRAHLPQDERHECFYIVGKVPEIRIEAGDPWHCSDWQSFRTFCWHLMHEQSLAWHPPWELRLFPKGRVQHEKRRARRRAAGKKERQRIQDMRDPKAREPHEELEI
jgi:hypothetical protein